MNHADTAAHFSLVRGGTLYGLARRSRLVGVGASSPRLAIVVVTVAWVPLAVAALVQHVTTGHVEPILRAFSVHLRFLVAVPLYFVAESSLDMFCARVLDRLDRGEYLDPRSRERMLQILHAAERWRDSPAAETILYAIAVLGGQASLWGLTDAGGFLDSTGPSAYGIGRVWYSLVALPIFQFLFIRMLYRWFIWCGVLYRLSRLPLKLVCVHPDRAGGIGFLSEPTFGLCYFFAGTLSVFSAQFATRIHHTGATLQSFAPEFLSLVVVCFLFAFVPLFAFMGTLHRAHLEGVHTYGHVATQATRQFQDENLRGQRTDDMLAGPYFCSMQDLATSLERVQATRLLPVELRPALAVLLATVLPVVPLVFAVIPLHVLFKDTMKLLLGG